MSRKQREFITGVCIGLAFGILVFGKLAFGVTITEEERDLMAATIEAEAGLEPLEGKILVAEVILNRKYDENFPNSVTEVIQQEGQFSTWSNGQIEKVVTSPEDYEAVKLALRKEERDPVFFFRNKHFGYGKPWGQVGNHYFSSLNE